MAELMIHHEKSGDSPVWIASESCGELSSNALKKYGFALKVGVSPNSWLVMWLKQQ
jgi:hypothetical protein